MIYLSLFWEFLKIGMFAFGGAYGAIPLIQESVLSQGWMDAAMFGNIIAISESTPGPIMVNAATYIGNTQGGFLGAFVATLGVVLPSFVIILLITALLRKVIKNKNVQAVLKGIKPCLMGIILATGLFMAYKAICGNVGSFAFSPLSLVILVALVAISLLWKKMKKKEISPILLIVLSAVMGCLLF